jgi:hypothetical protein
MELLCGKDVNLGTAAATVDVSRRKLLAAIVGGCVFGNLDRLVAANNPTLPPYCALDPNVDLGRYRARSSTGNSKLDRVLILELKSILAQLSVNPGFRIIDDFDSPNAFAMPRTIVGGTQGTVLFGINLIQSELNGPFGGYAVAGIAAHECAHIFQFFSRFGGLLTAGQRTARAMELHADCLAGYYLGRDRTKENQLTAFARSLFEKGDRNFNHRQHHGTPEERVRAMEQGYAMAKRNLPLAEIAEAATRFALR